LLAAHESTEKVVDVTASLGLLLKDDGTVIDVVPGKPASKSGVGPGMKLIAVNNRRWTAKLLRRAIADTATDKSSVRLLLESGDFFKTHTLSYAGGERYPALERDAEKKADLLAEIFKARNGGR